MISAVTSKTGVTKFPARSRKPGAIEHVALVSPEWPEGPNGIISYCATMRPTFESNGVRCSIITARARESEAGVFELPQKRTLRRRIADKINSMRVVPPAYAAALGIGSIANRLRETLNCQLVEMEETFGMVGAVARCTAMPAIARLHGPVFLMGPLVGADLKPGFARQARREGTAIAAAAGVTAPSKDVLRRVREHYQLKLAAAAVIPNPVAPCDESRRWKLADCDRNRILFVGRFDGHKGGDVMIEAFRQIADAHPLVKLTFVGPDNGVIDQNGRRWQIEDFIRSRFCGSPAREQIEWLGIKSRTEIGKLRRQSMVTVVCSRYETFGITAAEAMAAGSPIVATETGGLSELIQHQRNGLLCRPAIAEELAERILLMLQHPEMAATLGEQAARDASSRYHPQTIARKTIEFYQDTLDRLRYRSGN